MLQAYKDFWKRGLDFSGCSTRSEYWLVVLFHLVVFLPLIAIVTFSALDGLDTTAYMTEGEALDWVLSIYTHPIMIVIWLYNLAAFIPELSLVIRRLHDAGYSGWWYVGFIVASAIPFVGFIAAIIFLVFLVSPSKYGTDWQ